MEHKKDKYRNYRFPGQRSDENMELLIRKHWIVDLKIALALAFFGVLPLIAAAFVWEDFSDASLIGLLFFMIYLLLVLTVTYTQWMNNELDVIIVTNNRIIFHEQVDVFHRQISEANLSQIQDIKGIQKGMLQSLLDYGTIEVKTSSAAVFFVMHNSEKPNEMVRQLLDLRDQAL